MPDAGSVLTNHWPSAVDDEVRPAIPIPVGDERHVARHAPEHVTGARGAVPLRIEIPDAVAIDAEVGPAVAVDVAEHRDVTRTAAEIMLDRDHRGSAPCSRTTTPAR